MTLRNLFKLAKESVSAWIDDYAPSMGAALAYYTLFSIAPLLIIVIAVAGFVFGEDAVRGEIAFQLGDLIGPEGARAVQGLIASPSAPAKGVIATAVSLFVLLVGATTVFGELQSALDRIWRVPAGPKASGIWNLLRTRLLSFGLVLGMGFLLLVSLVISATLAAFGAWSKGALGDWEWILQLLNLVTSLAMETGLFAMIYKIMPRARIAWRDVWIGAGVTAAMFELGKLLIGLYLGKSGVTSGFGAAGSLVLLLVWVYYSAQIFLLGAEFTWLYAHRHGSKAGAQEAAPAPMVPSRSGEGEPQASVGAGSGDMQSRENGPIKKHPLGSLGLVVTAGLVAGTLVRRWLARSDLRATVRRRRWFA
jgi:membrane protein